MAEMGICSPHQPAGSLGNIFSPHIKGAPLYYTYFPNNKKCTVIQKIFLSPEPIPKAFPSFPQASFEGTYLSVC